MAVSGDGRIWLSAMGGIGWIDTSRVRQEPAPPVFVQSVTAEGARLNADNASSLSMGVRNLQVDYTALSYSHPERLRFRYRLDGVDHDWVDAGARRQAFYTNLGPGRYRFTVNVTNESGVWTDSAASLNFQIPPTFVQTRTFMAMCVATVLAFLALLYQARVRQLTARERALAKSRLKERERIARELHDTLLQGTQALILKIHSAAKLSERGEPVHELLNEAIDRASGVMEDGRDRIQDLRLSHEVDGDLATSLTKAGEELSQSFSVRFKLAVEGRPRAVTSDVLQETYRVGREALLNAFRHANANSIEVQIIYGDEGLSLRVRDDGSGIEEKTVASGSLGGHWGLPGMRERAHQIGAELSVWTRPRAGTEIELRVPAAIAYVKRTVRPPWMSFGRNVRDRRR